MKHAALLALVALAGLGLAGCTGGPGGDAGHVVDAEATRFVGGDRVVGVGETVTFRMVTAHHTVDFAEGDAPVDGVRGAHSGDLGPGDEHGVTFTKPGTYPYFCAYHSGLSDGERVGMVGTITVT